MLALAFAAGAAYLPEIRESEAAVASCSSPGPTAETRLRAVPEVLDAEGAGSHTGEGPGLIRTAICRTFSQQLEEPMPATATNDTVSAKPERLEARVSRELKRLVQRAADMEGRSLTDFVVSALQESARESIRRHEVLTLTMRDSARFVEALLKPRAPNAALRKAARRHQEMTGG